MIKIARISYDPVIAYAAEELQRCLREMDRETEVLILTYPTYRWELEDVLWVGMDDALKEFLPNVKDAHLDDAIAIEVKGAKGFITGANPRAVLIAVYRYLRELGADWIRPGKDGELLPACRPENYMVSVREVPSCRHRGVCIEGSNSLQMVCDMIDWLPKVGMNAYFNQFLVPATFYERWYGHLYNPELRGEKISGADVEGIRDTTVFEMKRRGLLYHAVGHGWTCEPFGIAGRGWDPDGKYDIPEEVRQKLACVNGKRELHGNIPLDTNLCYSNPEVQGKMSDAVVEYCEAKPEIDYVHVWLADNTNNHCECENCIQKRPADWYIDILNLIDEKMTAKGLPAKIVFLMYCDLYWPPEKETLRNPDRFVLMFAPITRTYSKSLGDAGEFDPEKLPPYVRNHCELPRSVEENLAWLKLWQRFFNGDSFDYDYHYMWDLFRDIAHMQMNRVLFDDMKAMKKLGLNGMISCQNQRVWLPSGFGMTAMAAALWDENADYDQVADTYFRAAFGPDGALVRGYLEELSQKMTPAYFRGETEDVSPEIAGRYREVPKITGKFAAVIRNNLEKDLPENVEKSWEYLELHRQLSELLAEAAEARARGERQEAEKRFIKLCRYLQAHEMEMAAVFDYCLFYSTMHHFFDGSFFAH